MSLCQSFEEAADAIASGAFDVLLSDLNLDGGRLALDLLPLLRRSVRNAALPAIVLSAHGRMEDRQATLAAGFVAHLVKPVEAETVARALLDAARQISGGSVSRS